MNDNCPFCLTKINGAEKNFCSICGYQLKKNCNCWVLNKLHNCCRISCPGIKYAIESFKNSKNISEKKEFEYAIIKRIAQQVEWMVVDDKTTICLICQNEKENDHNENCLYRTISK